MRKTDSVQYEHMTVDPAMPGSGGLRVRPIKRLSLRQRVACLLQPLRRFFCRHRFKAMTATEQRYLQQYRYMVDCECLQCGAWYYACRELTERELTSARYPELLVIQRRRAINVELTEAFEKAASGWWRFL